MINTIAHPVEVYRKFSLKSFKKEWRFRIRANNGNIIASSSEGYINRIDLIDNIASTSASLGEFISEEEGGINYSHTKITLNKKKNE